MAYIFYLFIDALEGALTTSIASIIIFFISNFVFHVFLILKQQDEELFWSSLFKSTKYYFLKIIPIYIIIKIIFGMLTTYVYRLHVEYQYIFHLQLIIGRILYLLILSIGAFFSMKNSDISKNIRNRARLIISFVFCSPFFYLLYKFSGIDYSLRFFFG